MSTDTDAPPYDPRYDEADPFLAPTGPEGPTPPPPRANGHRANPHDTDAEEAVLGAILISTQARDDTFATGLAPHHFYAPHHGAIYDAIAKVDNAGDLPDLITLSAHLGDSPDVQNRIINLQAGHTWEARNASAYARRVIHMARLRTVMAGAIEAAEHARADNLPAAVSAIEAFIVPEDTSSHGIAHTLLGDFLANDEPDHDWVIPGLLERTDRILLTGPEGGGKSTLLRQIAVQAAAGIHPFTHQEMAPLRVLLLDLENSERQIRRALRPLHVTAGGGADDNLTVAVHPQGLDLNDPTDVATLTHLIATVQPELVVGGPIYKLVGGDPTEEQPAKAAAMTLDRLRVAYGFALALETHQPHGTGSDRPERPYGASLWKRWPEFGLHISEAGLLRHWRGARDERDWPAALVRGGDWPWSMEVSSAVLTYARIAELVRQHGRRMSERELAMVTGAPKSNVHRAIEANKAKFEALCAGFEEEM